MRMTAKMKKLWDDKFVRICLCQINCLHEIDGKFAQARFNLMQELPRGYKVDQVIDAYFQIDSDGFHRWREAA